MCGRHQRPRAVYALIGQSLRVLCCAPPLSLLAGHFSLQSLRFRNRSILPRYTRSSLMSSSQLIGSVVSLWRYPVKSMMGEELTSAEVTKFGLLGDRAYAVVDVETGKVASAKNPKKWPNLFSFRAAYIEPPRVGEEIPPIRITLPDGIMVSSDDADVDATLSRALGREVALSRSTAKPSLEEYWPNIEGLTHKDAVTDEPIPEGTFSIKSARFEAVCNTTFGRKRLTSNRPSG